MSRNGYFTLMATTLLASTLATTAMAEAYGYQVLGKKYQVTRPEEADRITNVYNYDRPEYTPEGVNAGGFKIYATAGVDVTYNDNIYASNTNEESDIITVVSPAVVAKSNWGRHEVLGRAYANIGRYADNDAENFEDFGTSVAGRFDVKRNSYAIGRVGFARKHEERGAPNASTTSKSPTEYDEKHLQVGYIHAPGRVSLSGFVDVKNLDFENGRTTTGAVVTNDTRDRNELTYTMQAGYEIRPEYEAFIRTTFKDISYDQTASQGRDNDGFSVVVGTAMDLSGKVRGEVFAGYTKRDYKTSTTFKSVNKPVYGASILWNVNGLTSVNAKLARSIEETVTAGASAYMNTASSVSVQHELRRNVLLSANAGYANHDYIGYTSIREDIYITAGIEGRYLINKRFSVGLGYDYLDRDSNIVGNDYDRNRVMLKLTGSF